MLRLRWRLSFNGRQQPSTRIVLWNALRNLRVHVVVSLICRMSSKLNWLIKNKHHILGQSFPYFTCWTVQNTSLSAYTIMTKFLHRISSVEAWYKVLCRPKGPFTPSASTSVDGRRRAWCEWALSGCICQFVIVNLVHTGHWSRQQLGLSTFWLYLLWSERLTWSRWKSFTWADCWNRCSLATCIHDTEWVSGLECPHCRPLSSTLNFACIAEIVINFVVVVVVHTHSYR